MNHRIFILISLPLFFALSKCPAQTRASKPPFTHADTLRGSISPERAWWDVLHYTIQVRPDFDKKFISGSNEIQFKVISPGKRMQIDLQEPMNILDIQWNNQALPFEREANVFFVDFPSMQKPGDRESILIHFEGHPRIAVRPPWDGGWIFTRDKLGRPWMTVACQGLGASVWYPCKDIQSDEPDNGAILNITVPDTLIAVGNGRLSNKKSNKDHTVSFEWSVVSPINNYDIIPYIGKYLGWDEEYPGEKGKLDCSFWVLDYNLAKAMEQFKQVDTMLHCFEYWMGPYPFYEDGYKLVEAPHLGMEHQSAIAYGNQFANGYLGRDLSGSGWGLKWDFIIVHESGHEWFGNNITSNDLADMWIHEGFTNYSETLFTTCRFGVEAGDDYCIGTRKNILNDRPIIAPYGVNAEGSGDMYYKGGNMLHMIRQIINNDEKFREIWRGLNQEFYHRTVSTKQIEDYISQHAGIDFSKVFDQYLRTIQIPVLEYKTSKNAVRFRWTNCVAGFDMAVKVKAAAEQWIKPTPEWQTRSIEGYDGKTFIVDRNFYIQLKKID
jgi:aminopeptidase N